MRPSFTLIKFIGRRRRHPRTGRSVTASNGSLAFVTIGCDLHRRSQSRIALDRTNATAHRRVTVVWMGVATALACTVATTDSLGAEISPSVTHVIRGLTSLPESGLGRQAGPHLRHVATMTRQARAWLTWQLPYSVNRCRGTCRVHTSSYRLSPSFAPSTTPLAAQQFQNANLADRPS
jgi:hypothetical protein